MEPTRSPRGDTAGQRARLTFERFPLLPARLEC
jgi:hypothetical protein